MPYDEFDDMKSQFTDEDIKDLVDDEEEEADEPEIPEVEELPKSAKSAQSVLDDDTALHALGLLKHILRSKGCVLLDFRIGFDATGFDIKGLHIRCRNPRQILDALKNVETAPGQLKPQSQYHKLPNSYTITAILGELKDRAENELGLAVRAAAYENDYVVISFFPAEEKPAPPIPPMPTPDITMEPTPEPGQEQKPEEAGAEIPEEGVPPENIDWESLGI